MAVSYHLRSPIGRINLLASLVNASIASESSNDSQDASKCRPQPTVGKPAHLSPNAISWCGSGMLGAIAGTAVGVVAGSLHSPDVELMPLVKAQ